MSCVWEELWGGELCGWRIQREGGPRGKGLNLGSGMEEGAECQDKLERKMVVLANATSRGVARLLQEPGCEWSRAEVG